MGGEKHGLCRGFAKEEKEEIDGICLKPFRKTSVIYSEILQSRHCCMEGLCKSAIVTSFRVN